jgi:hypothetical protein
MNNDESLKITWEHKRAIQLGKGRGGEIGVIFISLEPYSKITLKIMNANENVEPNSYGFRLG